MLAEILVGGLLICLVTTGLAWPIAARLPFPPAERWLATLALSLLGTYLVGFCWYLAGLATPWLWTLPLAGAVGLVYRREDFCALWSDAQTKEIMAGQALVTLWTLGWLAMIVSYSGAAWGGDWLEHWQRALFFADRWPREAIFIRTYPLPARPPLVNIVTGVFLALTGKGFAPLQVYLCLLGSLVFTPAALLANRFSGNARHVIPLLALLLMVNPMFVQNATFAWTKLPAAFLVLASLYFFMRGTESTSPSSLMSVAVLCLAASVLAHYSAGPYVVALVVLWLARASTRWKTPGYWVQTAKLALLGATVLATWFAWSLDIYGPSVTFLSNTSLALADANHGGQLAKIAGNIVDTFVPPLIRPDGLFHQGLLQQDSTIAYIRDKAFLHYQVNLPFAFGTAALLPITVLLVRQWRTAGNVDRGSWLCFVTITVVLGIAVHGDRDRWGLAHICLQPLVVIGLAFLAANLARLGRGLRIVLLVGGAFDLAAGIILHFAIQGFLLDRWSNPALSISDAANQLNIAARLNLLRKSSYSAEFFSDVLLADPRLVLALLVTLLTWAIIKARPHFTSSLLRSA